MKFVQIGSMKVNPAVMLPDFQKFLKPGETFDMMYRDMGDYTVVVTQDDCVDRNPEEISLLYRAIPQEIRKMIIEECRQQYEGRIVLDEAHVVATYNDNFCTDPEKWFQDALELTL